MILLVCVFYKEAFPLNELLNLVDDLHVIDKVLVENETQLQCLQILVVECRKLADQIETLA